MTAVLLDEAQSSAPAVLDALDEMGSSDTVTIADEGQVQSQALRAASVPLRAAPAEAARWLIGADFEDGWVPLAVVRLTPGRAEQWLLDETLPSAGDAPEVVYQLD